jgi:uncharacterized membrane protein YbaN (DUF454 family)
MNKGIKLFWLVMGCVSLVIGAVGAVLPLLPTTPLLLLAAYAFARSSPRLQQWLHDHATFGPMIQNWHQQGSIDRKSKRLALIVIIPTPLITWLLGAPLWVLLIQVLLLTVVTIFIVTRPLPVETES